MRQATKKADLAKTRRSSPGRLTLYPPSLHERVGAYRVFRFQVKNSAIVSRRILQAGILPAVPGKTSLESIEAMCPDSAGRIGTLREFFYSENNSLDHKIDYRCRGHRVVRSRAWCDLIFSRGIRNDETDANDWTSQAARFSQTDLGGLRRIGGWNGGEVRLGTRGK